ncbi:hypothetical protein ACLMJK_007111 [Lecanora helva]
MSGRYVHHTDERTPTLCEKSAKAIKAQYKSTKKKEAPTIEGRENSESGRNRDSKTSSPGLYNHPRHREIEEDGHTFVNTEEDLDLILYKKFCAELSRRQHYHAFGRGMYEQQWQKMQRYRSSHDPYNWETPTMERTIQQADHTENIRTLSKETAANKTADHREG